MSNIFLLNDFYTIETLQKNENVISAKIILNPSHAIFKGHFEQMPVVPGVCQTQMIKEVLQQELNINLMLLKGDNIKFTGMIIPTQHPSFLLNLKYNLVENNYVVEASLFFENTIFTKFKGTFIKI
jgi:3-hydroxyacyl-[acyl-carrier-protein] dehydratase